MMPDGDVSTLRALARRRVPLASFSQAPAATAATPPAPAATTGIRAAPAAATHGMKEQCSLLAAVPAPLRPSRHSAFQRWAEAAESRTSTFGGVPTSTVPTTPTATEIQAAQAASPGSRASTIGGAPIITAAPAPTTTGIQTAQAASEPFSFLKWLEERKGKRPASQAASRASSPNGSEEAPSSSGKR
jgi:hypothetical protein